MVEVTFKGVKFKVFIQRTQVLHKEGLKVLNPMIYGKWKTIDSTHGRKPKPSLTRWKGNNAFGRELLKAFLWCGQECLFPLLHKPKVDNGLEDNRLYTWEEAKIKFNMVEGEQCIWERITENIPTIWTRELISPTTQTKSG
jgi:hypothetical protein